MYLQSHSVLNIMGILFLTSNLLEDFGKVIFSSPHPYIFVANILSFMMKKTVEDGIIEGIKLNFSSPTISHLLFADDSIFLLDWSIQECQSLLDVTSVWFCYWTGDKPKQIRNTL